MRATCPKCKKLKYLTRHHVFPVRHYGRKSKHFFYLCRACHDLLEEMIPFEQQAHSFYKEVIVRFLRD